MLVSAENLIKDEAAGEVYFGSTQLFGVDHHVRLVRVHQVIDNEFGVVFQEPVRDPLGLYKDIQVLNPVELRTVRVPGLEGDYVLTIYPYGC